MKSESEIIKKTRRGYGYKVIISKLNLFSRTGWICRFIPRQGVQRTFINYFGYDEKLTVEILSLIVILPKSFSSQQSLVWRFWSKYQIFTNFTFESYEKFLTLMYFYSLVTTQHLSENLHMFFISDSEKNSNQNVWWEKVLWAFRWRQIKVKTIVLRWSFKTFHNFG